MFRFSFWVYVVTAIIFSILTLRLWSRVDIGKHTRTPHGRHRIVADEI